ncbi:carbon-nitrogen hydrolase family protein [Candidatus Woesearchaeota archaeon]|nr:carbon-nitrogen hydrolase family protein [Candidatus Woesearchaeota archaeon]
MEPNLVKITVLQYKVKRYDRQYNLDKTIELLEEAVKEKPHFILIPNYFLQTGLETLPGETTRLLADIAKRHDTYIIGGIAEKTDEDKGYNSTFLITPKGEVKVLQSKIHMIEMEKKRLKGASRFFAEKTEHAVIGAVMCGDIFYPEVARSVALLGAEIIFVPSIMGGLTLNGLDLLSKARAVENQCYVVNANAIPFEISEERPDFLWGRSGFYAPFLDGITIKKMGAEEGLLSVVLDMDELREMKQTSKIDADTHEGLADIRGTNMFFSRRPEDYSIITDKEVQKKWDDGNIKTVHKHGKHYCEIRL